jgi:hypothetical protein
MANHAAPHKLMYAKAALGCALCILGKESEWEWERGGGMWNVECRTRSLRLHACMII